MSPLPKQDQLIEHYNTTYRKSEFTISLKNNLVIDLPIKIPLSGYSFLRFKSFYDLLDDTPNVPKPKEGDFFIDYGGYQGFFLLATKKVFGVDAFNYDYNSEAVEFAKNAFSIDGQVAKEIESDTFDRKADFVSLIHVFEHLERPVEFLKHLKCNVLNPNGIVYIEVPNIFGTPLCDPTHFFTYSEISLRNVFQTNGFEVLTTRVHGNPRYGIEVDSDRLNISLLARPLSNDLLKKKLLKPLSHSQMTRQIKTSYSKVHFEYIIREFKRNGVSLCKLLAHVAIYSVERLLNVTIKWFRTY